MGLMPDDEPAGLGGTKREAGQARQVRAELHHLEGVRPIAVDDENEERSTLPPQPLGEGLIGLKGRRVGEEDDGRERRVGEKSVDARVAGKIDPFEKLRTFEAEMREAARSGPVPARFLGMLEEDEPDAAGEGLDLRAEATGERPAADGANRAFRRCRAGIFFRIVLHDRLS